MRGPPVIRKWWLTDYAQEINNTLKIKEAERVPFKYRSPQVHFREHLVTWLCEISETIKLSTTTVHLAIYILDLFMDNHYIKTERLMLVGLTCLLLSAKFEEKDLKVPRISELNVLTGNQYLMSDFVSLEVMTLKFLNWNLLHPTAANFLEYYVGFAVSPDDLKFRPSCESFSELEVSVQESAKDFLNDTLKDVKMHEFMPSVVAASCVYAARSSLLLKPGWTLLLIRATELVLTDIKDCVVVIGRMHRKRESPDHGYVSDDGSPRPTKVRRTLRFQD